MKRIYVTAEGVVATLSFLALGAILVWFWLP